MRRILLAAFAAFFICGVLVAQDAKSIAPAEPAKAVAKELAKQIDLTPEQSVRVELALLRSANALMSLESIRVEFDKQQAEFRRLQQAATDELQAIAKEIGVDGAKYIITPDYKKLILKDEKK